MAKMRLSFVCALALLSSPSVKANIEVDFVESAPKDLFKVRNTGACTLQELILTIDLRQSDGRLIFDTTASGAGVDVFQPFEAREGGIELLSSDRVSDGDADLSLKIDRLPPGRSASFTIDVDDTLPNSELGKTRVAGSEINNGLVKLSVGDQQPVTAVFGADSKAIIFLPLCP
ncbi:MAG: aggregation factor core [Gammaproteobacteria bacterium]|nr:aggregation factor core [Gammaproteobacteria bacterium]